MLVAPIPGLPGSVAVCQSACVQESLGCHVGLLSRACAERRGRPQALRLLYEVHIVVRRVGIDRQIEVLLFALAGQGELIDDLLGWDLGPGLELDLHSDEVFCASFLQEDVRLLRNLNLLLLFLVEHLSVINSRYLKRDSIYVDICLASVFVENEEESVAVGLAWSMASLWRQSLICVPVGEPRQPLVAHPPLLENQFPSPLLERLRHLFTDCFLHGEVNSGCEPPWEGCTAHWAAHALLQYFRLALEAEEMVARCDDWLDA